MAPSAQGMHHIRSISSALREASYAPLIMAVVGRAGTLPLRAPQNLGHGTLQRLLPISCRYRQPMRDAAGRTPGFA
jgi:hypothetical protein